MGHHVAALGPMCREVRVGVDGTLRGQARAPIPLPLPLPLPLSLILMNKLPPPPIRPLVRFGVSPRLLGRSGLFCDFVASPLTVKWTFSFRAPRVNWIARFFLRRVA